MLERMASAIAAAPEPLSMRDKVFMMEDWMREQPSVLTELPVKHYFSEGVYARELFIPADTMLTGKVHKYQNLNILSQGEISVLTEDGIKRVKAPFTVVSPPGTKRIAYAHTDCVWTTIFVTNETDPEKIVELFTADSEAEYQAFLAGHDVLKELECQS